jgi:predicted ATPase
VPHLARVTRKEARVPSAFPADGFPFAVPAIRALTSLDLDTPVTFLVGENGSGKSTLLEGIAAAAELRSLGSAELSADDSLAAQRALADTLRLGWTRRTRVGFFLRAEDFFGYVRRLARNDARLVREEEEAGLRPVVRRALDDRDGAAHVDEVASARFLVRRDARSHGESFFDLFESNLFSGGLYLLDEPEAPLSPQRQLAFLALLDAAVRDGGQFVIATHSPILLAYPGARIYSFDSVPVRAVAFEELDHVTITRDFLNEPQRYLRHLFAPEA